MRPLFRALLCGAAAIGIPFGMKSQVAILPLGSLFARLLQLISCSGLFHNRFGFRHDVGFVLDHLGFGFDFFRSIRGRLDRAGLGAFFLYSLVSCILDGNLEAFSFAVSVILSARHGFYFPSFSFGSTTS